MCLDKRRFEPQEEELCMTREKESVFDKVLLTVDPEEHQKGSQDPFAARKPIEVAPETPFRILIAGDFSGRAWRENVPPSFTPKMVDRDNFDEVLAGLRVALDVDGVPLSFQELEDFHPDRLYNRVPLFQKLDALIAEAPRAAKAVRSSGQSAAASGGLLDQIIAEHNGEPEPASRVSIEDANDLAAFIRRVSAGYVVPRETPEQQQREAKRNSMAQELMRRLLHNSRFQSLEAAWRALFMLVRGLNTDADLKIYILDASLPELVRGMDTIKRALAGVGRWGVIAANFSFGQSATDTAVLERLAGFAKSLGAPLLAEARLTDDSPSPEWQALRRSRAAEWIGLSLPRFLLRLPYGKNTSAIESFPFEEMPESNHSAYLWGNPAFFCADLLGQSFLQSGWKLWPLQRRIDGLPLHVYEENDESVTKPCAEVLMTERDAEQILDAGLMPLATLKNQDAALIVRFQSIAQPATALAGIS
jgi:type VI secretion system protein ImpC